MPYLIEREMPERILIVDDEESILFAMSDYLTARGYQVDCARGLEEAEALLSRVRYAGVIADLRLSGSQSTEGLAIVGRVRARSPSTRTIILTAYGSPQIEREARRQGVDAFLHKPVPLSKVAQIVGEVIAARDRES
jgi:DNA-binding NtrC family response regulator